MYHNLKKVDVVEHCNVIIHYGFYFSLREKSFENLIVPTSNSLVIISQVFYLHSHLRKKRIFKRDKSNYMNRYASNIPGECHFTGILTWTEGTSVKAFIKSSSSTAPAPPSLEAPAYQKEIYFFKV